METIYLDYQSTTPVDPRVFEAMEPFFKHDFGNASSAQHPFGWSAQKAVEKARAQVARLIGAKSREIYFTSGATESINWVFFHWCEKARSEPVHLLTSHIEHAATREAARRAETFGVEVSWVETDRFGRIAPEQIQRLIRPHTKLVSLIQAHNEIGTLNPIAQIGEITSRRGIWFHADSVQAVGKIPVQVDELRVDLLSLSAHKLYGPKGVGALYKRSQPRLPLSPFVVGGGQEQGLRAGTLNVPGIVGLGAACELARLEMEAERERLELLRQSLMRELAALGGVRFNGHPEHRIPGALSVTFEGVRSADLFPYLKGLAVSTGSACASHDSDVSPVLLHIGLSEEQARSTLRIGLGRMTQDSEIARAAALIRSGVTKIRGFSRV